MEGEEVVGGGWRSAPRCNFLLQQIPTRDIKIPTHWYIEEPDSSSGRKQARETIHIHII